MVSFCLGVAAENIHQDQHMSHLPNIHVYLPSKKNIFVFERSHQVDLPKEAVGLVLESVVVTCSTPETKVLTEEIYEGVVSIFRVARDLCREGDENIADFVTVLRRSTPIMIMIIQTVLSVQTLSCCRPFALPEEEVSTDEITGTVQQEGWGWRCHAPPPNSFSKIIYFLRENYKMALFFI